MIIESLVEIVATLVITLIGVLGTWLTAKIGKREELKNINLAQQEVFAMAAQTVEELQQTIVDGLKEANEDGRLTEEEIAILGETLVDGTMAKMSSSAYKLLDSAGVDIVALIKGAGESWIAEMKKQQ